MPEPEHRPSRTRGLWETIVIVLAVDVILVLVMSGGRPGRPSLGAQTLPTTPPARVTQPSSAVEVVARPAAGAPSSHCFLLASTVALRERGLSGRPLGAHTGLVLLWPAATTTPVRLTGVAQPITIAFYGVGGHFLSSVAARPCPSGLGCEAYRPVGPFQAALLVPTRTFAGLGLSSGSSIHFGGSCSG